MFKLTPPNSIICGDVLESLRCIDPNSIHLIVTSPPFNVRIKYDNYNDNIPHSTYLAWLKDVWTECLRVLVCGGRICVNIDATMNMEKGSDSLPERVHPLHVDITNQLRDLGYIYRCELSWAKHNSSGSDTCWGSWCSVSNPHIRRNTEYIIVASKESLRLDGDPKKVDITKDEFMKWTLSDWRITPETKNKLHPAPFPRELVHRCIKLFSYVGNIVLDPFNGSGTTTSTAYELGRRYIGIDLSTKYCEYATSTISRIKSEFKIGGEYHFVPPSSVPSIAVSQISDDIFASE